MLRKTNPWNLKCGLPKLHRLRGWVDKSQNPCIAGGCRKWHCNYWQSRTSACKSVSKDLKELLVLSKDLYNVHLYAVHNMWRMDKYLSIIMLIWSYSRVYEKLVPLTNYTFHDNAKVLPMQQLMASLMGHTSQSHPPSMVPCQNPPHLELGSCGFGAGDFELPTNVHARIKQLKACSTTSVS